MKHHAKQMVIIITNEDKDGTGEIKGTKNDMKEANHQLSGKKRKSAIPLNQLLSKIGVTCESYCMRVDFLRAPT